MFGTACLICLETLRACLAAQSLEAQGLVSSPRQAILVTEGLIEGLNDLSSFRGTESDEDLKRLGYEVVYRSEELLVVVPVGFAQLELRRKKAELLLGLANLQLPDGLGSTQSVHAETRELIHQLVQLGGMRTSRSDVNFAIMKSVVYTIEANGQTLELPPLPLTKNVERMIEHLTEKPALVDNVAWTLGPPPNTPEANKVKKQATENKKANWLVPQLSFKFLSHPMPRRLVRYQFAETALNEVGSWVMRQEASIDQVVDQADRIIGSSSTVAKDLQSMPYEYVEGLREMTRSTAIRLGLATAESFDQLWATARVGSVSIDYDFAVCTDKGGQMPVVGSLRLGRSSPR